MKEGRKNVMSEETYHFVVNKGFLKRGFVRGGGGKAPDTGYYKFVAVSFEPFGDGDKNGAVSVGVKADFADIPGQWGRGRAWLDFLDSEGAMVPAVADLAESDEAAFNKLLQAYATNINTFAASCGCDMDALIGEEADDDEEFDPTTLVGSTFYGVWLAPLKSLVPKEEWDQYDFKKSDGYGSIDQFIAESQYETFMATGALPKDDRTALLAKKHKKTEAAADAGTGDAGTGDAGTTRLARRTLTVNKPADKKTETAPTKKVEEPVPPKKADESAGVPPRRARTTGNLPGAPRKA